jgi:hypothetical protein
MSDPIRQQDVIEAVGDVLRASGLSPVFLRRLSALDSSPEGGAVVRPGPLRVLNQYINGTSEVALPIRVMVKRREASVAMSEAEDAAEALGGLVLPLGGGVALSCDEGRAHELELSDAGWYVWETDATAAYTIEAREAIQ